MSGSGNPSYMAAFTSHNHCIKVLGSSPPTLQVLGFRGKDQLQGRDQEKRIGQATRTENGISDIRVWMLFSKDRNRFPGYM